MQNDRPELLQTYAPYLEFYISVPKEKSGNSGGSVGGMAPPSGTGEMVNILVDKENRPRTLVSFSHTITSYGHGTFRLEVFDPNYTDIEELILAFNASGVDISEDTVGAKENDPPKDKQSVMNFVFFRYGYVDPNGKKVLSSSPEGEKYFVGNLVHYTPSMRTSGTTLIIDGTTGAASNADMFKKIRVNSSFYDLPLYDMVRKICEMKEWELRGTGVDELSELPPQKQPEILFDTGQSIDTTEEQPRTIKVSVHDNAYSIIKKICNYARSVDPKYGSYSCHLLYSLDDPSKKPKGYLYFGPEDPTQDPVRQYVYMRDKYSDLISFTPTVIGIPGFAIGTFGMVAGTDNVRHGKQEFHQYSELDRQCKVHNKERPKSADERPDDGKFQEGIPEIKDEEERKKVEGTVHGGHALAPPAKIPPDEPVLEHATRSENILFSDRETMNYWLSCNTMATEASMEIFGDPGGDKPALLPSKLVDVFIFAPLPNGTFKLHYLSNRWLITGVTHHISGGTYTTNLLLKKAGFHKGGTGSKAQTVKLLEDSLEATLGKDAMRKVSI